MNDIWTWKCQQQLMALLGNYSLSGIFTETPSSALSSFFFKCVNKQAVKCTWENAQIIFKDPVQTIWTPSRTTESGQTSVLTSWFEIKSTLKSTPKVAIWFDFNSWKKIWDLIWKSTPKSPKFQINSFSGKCRKIDGFSRIFKFMSFKNCFFFFNFPHPMKLWKFLTLKFKRQRKNRYYLRWK